MSTKIPTKTPKIQVSETPAVQNVDVSELQPEQATVPTKLKADSESDLSNSSAQLAKEINGPRGLEPTRYGDWESKGRCYDF
ncbi:DUF1674 domain-containing protein [Arenicella xantha]|uniref:DUF1674 domain-containing protein n=1 Tax=Arenicella xantha TaxID=644221 RepID=A0A395JJN4_9GAMM|nr:succinate dehydrogenase assembly factor 4 [Arenicella xantha]RBP49261.1 hypothetical protein DFR28_104189 [Arenicella xantha]